MRKGGAARSVATAVVWIVFVLALVGAGVPAHAQDASWRARVELRRENSSRGRPEESTKTTLRVEAFVGRAVESLRLDLALPDERQEFSGSILSPRIGDIAARVRFRPWRFSGFRVVRLAEVTFPTAHPSELGGGRYRLSTALRVVAPLRLPAVDSSSHVSRFELESQMVRSFGGDADRRRFSHIRFDVSAHSEWRRRYTTSLRLRPAVDWVADGRTGAVAEVEGGRVFARDWRAWLMVGRRVWGESDIASTYDTRIGLGVVRTF